MNTYEKNKDIVWAGIVLMILILVSAFDGHCQTPSPTPAKEPLHSTKHTDKLEQEDEIRFMTVNVSSRNGNIIYFYREGKREVQVSMLFWDDQSIYFDPDGKPPYQFTGCYEAQICLKHAYLYALQRMPCSKETGGFYFVKKKP